MAGFDSRQSRRRRPPGETSDPKKSIAVYCEGQTEEVYFKEIKKTFRIPNLNIIPICLNEQGNALTLSQEAVQRKMKQSEYDEYWLVIDKDDTPQNTFEDAVDLAEQNGIKPAYSIQAFEIWLILHFIYTHDRIDRKDYEKKLNDFLKNCSYGKTKIELEKIFAEIIPLTQTGIKNAKQALSYFEKNKIQLQDRESFTLVFKLIESILPNQGMK